MQVVLSARRPKTEPAHLPEPDNPAAVQVAILGVHLYKARGETVP